MEDERRLLATLRYVRRRGVEFDTIERCVRQVRDEETVRSIAVAMAAARASTELVRARKDAEGES